MIWDKNDKNIVRNAMIVIFLSLTIVYVIRYQVNDTDTPTANNERADTISDSLIINPITPNTWITMNDPNSSTQEDILEINWETTQTGDNNEQEIQEGEEDDEQTQNNQDMKILSWTTLYFGPIEGIDTLDIEYRYALRDDRNIYFTYLENEPDLSSIARSLWWTLYTMNTETEIVRNDLFGNRVIFINLPEYQNNIVLMYVELGQEKWLLQISYNIYHESKRYLQNLFID